MTETASLVIKVDSSGAKRATHDLDALAKQGAKTEGAVARLGKGVGALGSAFAAIGGGVLIGKFLGAVIANTIEADKVQAQLAARIKSTGGAAGLALGELNAMAKGLQNVTTYGDEAVGEAQALLLTFTKIGKEVFPQTLETVLDMSTALGQDLKSSAVQLGKALQDPVQGITALRRVGVNFSDSQKKVIEKLVETNRSADAQRLILAELQTEFGGAARAARNTLGGALQAAKEAFGDLLEGDSGSDGVRGTKKAIDDLIRTMQSPQTKSAFASLVAGIFSVANAAVVGIQKLIDFNNQLEVSMGLKGAGNGKRNANVFDFFGGAKDRAAALLRGDAEGASLAGQRMAAGFSTKRYGQVADFTNVVGAVNANAPDFSNVVSGNAGSGVDISGLDLSDKKKKSSKSAFNAQQAAAERFRDALADLRGEIGGPLKAAEEDHLQRVAELNDLAKKGKIGSDELATALSLEGERYKAATDEIKNGNDALVASFSGPLAQAQNEHMERLRQIDALAKEAGLTAEKVANLKAIEAKRYEEETAQIAAQLDPARALIAEKERELDLLHLSGAARDTAIDLMRLEGKATDEQRAKLQALNEEYANTQRQVALMDDFRNSASNALTDFVTGAKSAKEALKDFFDEMAAQITKAIANKWMEQLFGAQGSTGSGTSGGNLFGSLLGMIFGGGSGGAATSGGGGSMLSWIGGGYASGGYTGAGAMTQPAGVVHKGEVVWSQADIAAAGGVGAVEAMRKGGGNVTNITVNVPRSFEYRTAAHVAQAAAEAQKRAVARNR